MVAHPRGYLAARQEYAFPRTNAPPVDRGDLASRDTTSARDFLSRGREAYAAIRLPQRPLSYSCGRLIPKSHSLVRKGSGHALAHKCKLSLIRAAEAKRD